MPQAPFHHSDFVIPCASKLARSSPYLLSTNLQTPASLILDLAETTKEEGKRMMRKRKERRKEYRLFC